MTGRPNRRSRAASLVLSLAWLPYLIVQCPSCPGATTSLVRCGADAQTVAQHANEGRKPRCHGDNEQKQHRHGPAADCCSFGENRAATHGETVTVSPPEMVSALWSLPEIALNRAVSSLPQWGSIEQQAHPPPLFLVLCSLLL